MQPTVLFDESSITGVSLTNFAIDTQITVAALGIPAGAEVTFEMVRLSSPIRPQICPGSCEIPPVEFASEIAWQPLMCCNGNKVKLTAKNPYVLLDSPQHVRLRALMTGYDFSVAPFPGEIIVYPSTSTIPHDAARGCCEEAPVVQPPAPTPPSPTPTPPSPTPTPPSPTPTPPTPTPTPAPQTAYAAGLSYNQISDRVAFDYFRTYNTLFDQVAILVRLRDFSVMAIKRYNLPDAIIETPVPNAAVLLGPVADGTYSWLVFDAATTLTQTYLDKLQGLTDTSSAVAWNVKNAAGTVVTMTTTAGAPATTYSDKTVNYPIPPTTNVLPDADNNLSDYMMFLVVHIPA